MWNLDQESPNVRDLSGSGSETNAGNGFKCLTYNFLYVFDVLVLFNGKQSPIFTPDPARIHNTSYSGGGQLKLFFPRNSA